jgi:putative heme iron utilization protein
VSGGHVIPGYDPGSEPAEPPTNPAAEPSHAERVRTLVAGQSRGSLGTLAIDPPGTPFGSIVTYGLDGRGRPVSFVSTLAEHTRNLLADPRASLLVVESVPDGADPLAAGRATLLGRLEQVADAAEAEAAKAAYLVANPQAFYVAYGDFLCVRLEVVSIRYVGGFGRMSWVDPEAYATAEADPLAAHAAGIIGHMNADHAAAMVELCHAYAGRTDVTAARMTAVDRYGFEVVADVTGPRQQAAFRVGFRTPQASPDGVRKELVAMLHAARR